MADQLLRKGVELDAITPELWSANFYPALLESLPFTAVVDRSYEGEIRALGDIVNISSIPQFDEATLIAEDERVDADAVTVSGQQLTINRQIVKDYIITERALRQSLDAENELRDLAFHSVMKKMQSLIIAATVPSASAPDHQIAYDSGTTLALADILEAKELLDAQNVPDDGQRYMILGAAQWNDLFNITGFTSRDFIPAGSPNSSGAFTTPLLGFQPRYTSVAGNVAYLFHKSYMTVAVQQMPEVKVFDLGVDGKRAKRVNLTVLMGEKQLSNLRVVEIA